MTLNSNVKLTDEEKRKFVAFLMSRYGIAMDVDNELLPVYYLAFRSGVLSEAYVRKVSGQLLEAGQKMETMAEEFNEATRQSLLRLQPRQFHFTSSKQAFWFRGGWPGLPIALVVVMGWGVWYYYQRAIREREDSRLILQFTERSEVFRADLGPHMHVQVIKLSGAGSLKEAEVGKNFFYDKKCDCILVPIDQGVH
jgi:hypothetical protein